MIDMKMIESQIKANLPEHVGNMLRKELDELHAFRKDAGQVQKVVAENAELRKQNNELTRNANAVEHGMSDLAAEREKFAITRREHDIKVLEAKLALANEKAEFCKNIALGLVRNVEYRQHVFGNRNEQASHPGAYAGQTVSVPHNEDRTTSAT